MPQTPTKVEIDRAVTILNRTDRGRAAMRDTLAMLDNGGIGLDQSGWLALMALLTAAFTSSPGSTRDAMREALAPDREDGHGCEMDHI